MGLTLSLPRRANCPSLEVVRQLFQVGAMKMRFSEKTNKKVVAVWKFMDRVPCWLWGLPAGRTGAARGGKEVASNVLAARGLQEWPGQQGSLCAQDLSLSGWTLV